MIIEKYGIQLKRITKNDIELIREKRNSIAIATKMIYREYISKDQQLKWFESINNLNNFYYLIIDNNKSIGLINEKDMDWNNSTSEAGMFIWEENYLKTIIPSLATLILIELGFEILSWKKTKIRILDTNKQAINYNKQIGFEMTENKDNVIFMELTKENYFSKTKKIVITASKSFKNSNLVIKIPNQEVELINKVKELLSSKTNIEFSTNVKNCFSFSHKIE